MGSKYNAVRYENAIVKIMRGRGGAMSHLEILRELCKFTDQTVSRSTFQRCMQNLSNSGIVERKESGKDGKERGKKVWYTLTGKSLPGDDADVKNHVLDGQQCLVEGYIYGSINELMIPLMKALKNYSTAYIVDADEAEETLKRYIEKHLCGRMFALRHAVEPPYALDNRVFEALCERYESDIMYAQIMGYVTMESDEDAKQEDYE